MNTAMKEIQDKIFNHQLRGSEKDTPKPLLHPKHDHINKWLGRLREHGFSLVLGFSFSAILLMVTVTLHKTPNHVFPQPNSFDLSNSPLLLQVGQRPDFSKEPIWDAVPSAMELAGEIPSAEDQYVPIKGEDHLAEDRERLEGKRAEGESLQMPTDAPSGPETALFTPSTDANATEATPAEPPCQGKQDCKVLKKKLAKMERKMWLSTKLEEKKRAHDAVLSTENGDEDASGSLGMDRSSTCKPGSAACTDRLDLTTSKGGVMCLIIFAVGYSMVMLEDHMGIGFKKSVPMTLATGMIWFILASEYKSRSASLALVSAAARHNLLEFSEVFLFLLVAMVYISTMEHMHVFESIKIWMLERGFGLKGMYWMCGLMAFFLAPVADSLTTALLVGTVAMKLMGTNKDYVVISCISIVVACNAGGVISPFGDVTSLMVWQKEKLRFLTFFKLLVPGIVNWLVPAGIMSLSLKDGESQCKLTIGERVKLHPGASAVCSLFFFTIVMSASLQSFVEIPAVLGMMTGLGLLMCYGMFYMQVHASNSVEMQHAGDVEGSKDKEMPKHVLVLDIFKRMESCDWDTLLFFYGIIMSVGALGLLGYLDLVVLWAYGEMGPSLANSALGLVSAFVDNIPVMFAILAVDPAMSQQQWLLVTLTTGVGGSMLSIGSAAGVGLMGATGGMYRFSDHLKWSWAIALGYFLSILTSLYVNGH